MKHAIAIAKTWAGVILLIMPSTADAQGPLRVHPMNPRYFADGTKNPDGSPRAIYLTGSHNWDTFQRWFEGEPLRDLKAGHIERFADYLDELQRHRHNLIRLWVADTAWSPITRSAIEPQPYVRTGPGNAQDGGLKFDLEELNPAYFEELRARVVAARERGMYVAVMLFNSWGTGRYQGPRHAAWPYHPFHAANNVNGIEGDLNDDGRGLEYHTLQTPAITQLQEAYIRRVIDTVGDLDNVLFEISNESVADSKDWQYHLITFIKQYEATRSKQHLVVMSGQGVPTPDLFASSAEVVAPRGMGQDFPAASGEKIVIVDSDHNGPYRRDPGFVWKSFLRGCHPIVMDWFSGTEWEPIRRAMGQTRGFAERIDLASMSPQGELSSTRFCLADPGAEYLVYQPSSRAEFTVTLAAGAYNYEWFDPAAGNAAATGLLETKGGDHSFQAPFSGEAVILITRKR